MDIPTKIWNNFKTQPDIWFFYGFLLTFTLSIRKVLMFYPIKGQFNEYAGIYLYLSDIFLILTLVAWGYTILCNNNNSLSNMATRFVFHVKNVPPQKECSTWNILRGRRRTFLLLPLILVIWSFISLIWADNKIIALFRSIKVTEFYLLYLYIIYNVPRGTFLKRVSQIVIAIGFIHAIIGIWQFIIQHSIGLFWLKESLISPNIDGVAKIIFHGEKFIRAYGLFPHSNILGGFLLVSIILTLAYDKLFHVEQLDRNWNHIVPRGTIARIILAIQIIVLILTFSKSAIIGLCIAIAYALWRNNKLFHVEQLGRKAFLAIGITLMILIIARPDTNSLLFKSLNERLFYLNVSRGTILSNPVLGAGSGQFVLEMDRNVPRGTFLEAWQYQPVHNVFLLIWSELGFVGLFILIWLLWKMFHVEQNISKPDIECSTWNNVSCSVYKSVPARNVPRGTFLFQQKALNILKGLILGLIFMMFFDHYLWDIQQGQIMLWMTLGLLAGNTLTKE